MARSGRPRGSRKSTYRVKTAEQKRQAAETAIQTPPDSFIGTTECGNAADVFPGVCSALFGNYDHETMMRNVPGDDYSDTAEWTLEDVTAFFHDVDGHVMRGCQSHQ